MLNIFKKLKKSLPGASVPRARISLLPSRLEYIFVLSDVHGELDLLLEAEQKIAARARGRESSSIILMLGDFVDRGPDSRGVIEHLVSESQTGINRIAICGNHDDLFLRFINEDSFDRTWLDLGGDRTLLSYGVDPNHYLRIDPAGALLKKTTRERVPAAHRDFLESLPVLANYGNYLFVHAGVLPGKPLSQQSDSQLMWIREPFLTRGPEMGDFRVVHGHTPSVAIQYGRNRIGIDTGAYATGKLSVLMIEPEGVHEI